LNANDRGRLCQSVRRPSAAPCNPLSSNRMTHQVHESFTEQPPSRGRALIGTVRSCRRHHCAESSASRPAAVRQAPAGRRGCRIKVSHRKLVVIRYQMPRHDPWPGAELWRCSYVCVSGIAKVHAARFGWLCASNNGECLCDTLRLTRETAQRPRRRFPRLGGCRVLLSVRGRFGRWRTVARWSEHGVVGAARLGARTATFRRFSVRLIRSRCSRSDSRYRASFE
jgi:hypothetical protein